MGKVKKGKKISKDDDIDDDYELESTATKNNSLKTKNEIDENHVNDNSEENEDITKKKKNKKDKKKKKVDEDEDMEEVAKDVEETSKKNKKKKKVSKSKSNSSVNLEDSDSEESSLPPKSSKSARGRSGFALIAPESDDDDDNDQAVDIESSDHEDIPKTAPANKSKEKKSKKKRNRHASDDDDDLDQMLSELRLEYEGKNPQEETNVGETNKESKNENKDDSKKSTKNKNEKIKNDNIEKDEMKNDNEIVENVGTVKTAAQKKKEKKEKQKKLAQSKKAEEASLEKQPSIEKNNVQNEDKNSEITNENPPKITEGEEETNIPGDEKKKKKKKGGKEETEKDDKKAGKGPNKKTIAAMQDALKKLKEDEEKLAREEEERIRKIEEAERAKDEQARLEKERKEKRKQKEKERKERLKAEGKLLTAKQKADRARAQAMLETLKAQGLVELPSERRPPASRARPGKKPKKDQQQQQPSDQKEQELEPQTQQEEVDAQQIQLEIVEATPDTSKESDDDVKDAWDAESSAEEEETKKDKSQHRKRDEARGNAKTSTSHNEAESDSDDETEDSESESEESDSSSENVEDKKSDAERKREKALKRIQKRRAEAEIARTPDDLRAAVVCVLGHVDTGKTKILDKLRGTNVQDGEAGGITQQIGATNVPVEAIQEQAKYVKDFKDTPIKLPGLLIIDTPGHESFSNLRSRGSSLCDIAILVVDIMHGLEPQTIESIELLKSRKTPFIIALNKIDRLYEWQTMSRRDIRDVIKAQASHTQLEFEQRTKHVILQFAEQGLNATLFYENKDPRKYLSLIPTSAITGEGMGNLLALLVESCQTMLTKRLMYSEELQATVLEVKAIPGLGTTIFAILVNGRLREGDTVVIAGTDGPIVTQIRSLIMPQPLRELRVKSSYVEYKEIRAAQGVKIAAKELDKAIAGLNLLVAQHPDEVGILCDEVKKELRSALSHIKLSERGVYVQASTLGSLEALLVYLESEKIPYSNVRIGPVARRDVTKASAMLEHDNQYATILAFNVKVDRDAQEMAATLGVRIFQAEIIYHLFDAFQKYRDELIARRREQFKNIAVFPCKLRVMPQFVFNSRDPIVVGVMVEAGIVREGTPICVPSREFVELGIVTSIESNHKNVETARKGLEVCIKIEPIPGEAPKMFGRHFDEKDLLVSKITRQSIDACKDHFREDLLKSDWQLMVELKKTFQIL